VTSHVNDLDELSVDGLLDVSGICIEVINSHDL
jgi:hypothetical protein